MIIHNNHNNNNNSNPNKNNHSNNNNNNPISPITNNHNFLTISKKMLTLVVISTTQKYPEDLPNHPLIPVTSISIVRKFFKLLLKANGTITNLESLENYNIALLLS